MNAKALGNPVRWSAMLCVTVVAMAACSSETPSGISDIEPSFSSGSTNGVYLCKYTADPTSQTFDFRVSADGGDVVGNGRFTLAATQILDINPACALVWTPVNGQSANVTIEEDVPTGWELLNVFYNQTGWLFPTPNPATVTAGPQVGLVIFKNRPDFDVALGRMTGGGGQVRVDDVYVSRGFTIHCDITLSNNVEVNWTGGNKWHLDKPLTSATCIDDPNVEPAPPPAPFDTFIGEGFGRLNGVDGSFIRFTFVDAGEPGGRQDTAAIDIWAPGADPAVDAPVLSVSGLLDNGNLQAHYDQPHGNKK